VGEDWRRFDVTEKEAGGQPEGGRGGKKSAVLIRPGKEPYMPGVVWEQKGRKNKV